MKQGSYGLCTAENGKGLHFFIPDQFKVKGETDSADMASSGKVYATTGA